PSPSSSPTNTTEIIIPQENISLKDDQTAMKLYNEQEINDALNLMNDDNKMKISLSIWDLGGQEVFYALHHLFLTKYAVYLCIFDMRQMISDKEEDRLLSMNYTNFWLRSIEMHARGAPIFLIGTFKDVISSSDQHEKINEILCLTLKF